MDSRIHAELSLAEKAYVHRTPTLDDKYQERAHRRTVGVHAREDEFLIQQDWVAEEIGRGLWSRKLPDGWDFHMQYDHSEASMTDEGNSMGKSTEVEKRPCLEKGHCPTWPKEKVQKADLRGQSLGGQGEYYGGPYMPEQGDRIWGAMRSHWTF